VLSGHAEERDIAPKRLYVTVDGAVAPMKDGWRECKVGAVYKASTDDKGEVVAHDIEHVGTFGNPEAIGDKPYALAYKRGVERCRDAVVLGDGGRWIWNQAGSNFPKATQNARVAYSYCGISGFERSGNPDTSARYVFRDFHSAALHSNPETPTLSEAC